MRYYRIEIAGAPDKYPPWDSFPNGRNNPNAQQIEMQLEIYVSPDASNSTLEIHGVSWEQIKYANLLIDKQITIYGGMSKIGLPLSVYQSRHQGLLVTGTIQKCWGNWVGTNMSLGFVITVARTQDTGSSDTSTTGNTASSSGSTTSPQARISRYSRTGARSIDRTSYARSVVSSTALVPTVTGALGALSSGVGGQAVSGILSNFIGGPISNFISGGVPGLTNPLNLIHNLLPNMKLSDAIQQTLSKALPGVPLRIAIHPLLKLAYQDAGMHQNMNQYIGYLNKLSQSIIGATQGNKNYIGVHASSNGQSMDIWDGTKAFGTTDITVGDLIGQPTWVDRYLVQVKVAMRSDLTPNTDINIRDTTLPDTLYNLTPDAILPGAGSEQVTNITLGGRIRIQRIRHIGDFRNPDGNSWCTIIDGWPQGDMMQPPSGVENAQIYQTPGSFPTGINLRFPPILSS